MWLRSRIPRVQSRVTLSIHQTPDSVRPRLRAILTLLMMSLLVLGSRADDETEGAEDSRNHTCSSQTCEARYKILLDSVDLTIEPCEDFFAHVCARYSPIETPLTAVFDFLENGNASNHAERQAQNFYESCRIQNDDEQQDRSSRALRDLIKDLGGWQLTAQSEDLNISQLVEKVHNKYGLMLFFSWDVNFENRNTSQHIIMVTPEDPKTGYWNRKGLGDLEEDLVFGSFLVEMIKTTDESEAGKPNDEQLRKLVKDMLLLNEELRDTLSHGLSYKKMSLGELDELLTFIDMAQFFQGAFSESDSTLTEDTTMSVFNPESFKKLSGLIKAHLDQPERKKTFVAYIKMRALVYWSQNLIHNRGHSMDSPCLEFTFKKLTQVMNSIYVKQTFPNNTNARQEVTDYFDMIREAFYARIANMTWLDEKTKETAAERLKDVKLLAGYPDLYFDDSYFDVKYGNLSLNPGNFLGNLLAIQNFNVRDAARSLSLPTEPTDAFDFYHAKETRAFYVRGVNTIFVLARLLQEPYYHDEYPGPVKFAALSYILSRELVHAFFDPDLSANSDGSWMTPESYNEYKNISQCFVDQYSQYSVNGNRINANRKLDEYISDTTGLSLGYEAYRLSTNVSDLIEISPQISWDQYYFMEFTHLLCEESAPAISTKEMVESRHAPNILRVNATLENSFEFNDAFNCYANLTEQCSLAWA